MSVVLERELLSVRDLQELSNESEACWRKRLAKGELPYIKLGENVRVRREDLERWLESRTVRRQGGRVL
jgi:excisionase family DNA binding protein